MSTTQRADAFSLARFALNREIPGAAYFEENIQHSTSNAQHSMNART
jgi:hypothetical protein